jgi:hypothetical protein
LLLLLLRFCSCSSQERFVIKNHEDINGTTEIAINDSPELIVHDNKEDIDYTYPDVEFHLDPNSDMIGGLSLSATTGVISGTSITPIDASNVIIAAKFKSQHLLNLLHESSNNVKEPTCRIKIEISEPEENRFEIYNFNQVSGEVGTALTPTNELRTTTNHMVEGGSPDLIVPQSDCIYGISPDISTYGLSFNTATGVISGTPTLGTPSEGVLLTVTVTSTNPLYIGVTPGSDQKHLFIIDSTPTPIELDITGFSDYFFYTGTSYTSGNVLTTKANPGNFTVSDAVYSITPNNLASYGLSFNSSTGEVTGTPTADLSETEYTVSVTSSTYSTCDSNDITFSIIIQTQVISIDCNFTITDTSGNNPVTYDITSITEFNKFCNDGSGGHVNITVEGHTFRKDQLIGINLPTDGMIGGSPLTTIPNNFLYYCTKFVNPFIIPNTVTTIGNYFMYYCQLYNEPITFPVAIASLGNSFMNGCNAFNKPITIPTTIGNAIPHNFLSSQNFNQPISIPSNFTRIGANFLSFCTSFDQSMIIPNTVTHIDPGLMQGCSSFNSTFTLPTTVDSFTHLFDLFPCN